MFRSRITGNFDTAKSQGATTALVRADGIFLLQLKKIKKKGGITSWTSGRSGGNGRSKRTNQKTEDSKENNRDIKEIWGNSKKKTHQSEIGDQKKNRNIKGIWGK